MLQHLTSEAIAELRRVAQAREHQYGDVLPPEAVSLLDPVIASLMPEARAELLALTWIGTGRRANRKWPLLMQQALRSFNAGNATYIASRLRVRYLDRALSEVSAEAA